MMESNQTQTFRLIACPTLSHERRQDQYCQTGVTIGESLRSLGWKTDGLHARVFIDGELVPDAEWEYATPTDGQAVVVRTIPQGGQGGKQIGMIVAMLALTVAAVFTAGSTLAFLPEALSMGLLDINAPLIAAGALLVGGSLAINALIAPSRPKLPSLSGQSNDSPALSLTGASNQVSLYGRIPRVYGTVRIYPTMAAQPFTEIVGNAQYLRLLYCFGYGPLVLSDIKIGETPISLFQGVEMEVRYGFPNDTPLTLISSGIIENNMSVKLTNAASWQQRTSEANAQELSLDIAFPSGLIAYDSKGTQLAWEVKATVEYRKVGDTSWIGVDSVAATQASATLSFPGANNDVTFTVRQPGAFGNTYVLIFNDSSGVPLSLNRFSVRNPIGAGPDSYVFVIYMWYGGNTTAAQLKAAIEANPDFNSIFQVSFPPGNDGTGLITYGSPFNFSVQMSGGKDLVPSLDVVASSQTLVRRSIRWKVYQPGASYEVRVRRVTQDYGQGAIRDEVFWTVLRTIQNITPIQKTGLCLLALRIKATDQLNGTVDTLNAIATSVLPDWNGTKWVSLPTNNPASIYRDVLQGTANRRPKTDDQLDLATIQDFHERCKAQGFAFNAVIDFQTTVKQLRQDVLAAGRGAFVLRDMKYSVLQDLVQDAPVDVITPRTSSGFKWTRRFLELPHAFRVRFVDETNNYKQGERIVYADGYNANNATIFEDTDAGLGVTNPTQVWRLKRRELAEAQLRADDYEVTVDFANLNVTRGDRVQLQHDVILAGLLSARIKSVTLDGGGQATAITFDESLSMSDGIDYAARIRTANGQQIVRQIVTVRGAQASVTFTTPIPASTVPAVGDLVVFGELGRETLDCIVKSVEPGSDYTAKLRLLDYAPAIQTADSAAIPPYDPQLTISSKDLQPVPIIVQAVSDESVLIRDVDGALQSRIVVSVHFSSGVRLPVSKIETQFRVKNSDDDWKVILSQIAGASVEVSISPVQEGLTYEIRLRTVDTETGATSAWATIDSHEVIGKSSPPPDVVTLMLEGDRLRWSYPNPPRDLAGFLVRFRPGTSRAWDGANAAHDHVILTTDFAILRQSAVQTFLVKAVDVAGNESANPATVTVNLGDLLLDNIVLTTDHRALGWPGTSTNGVVLGGNLEAINSVPFWASSSSASAWPLFDSALFWNDPAAELTYEFLFAPPIELLDATLKIDLTMDGDWRLDYSVDSTALMWGADTNALMWDADASTVMWAVRGEYIAWPGALAPLSRSQHSFRVTGSSGGAQAILRQLQVILDVPDLVDTFPDFVVAAGGSRPTLTKTYRDIVTVRMDLQDDGGTATYVKAMDKNPALGPLIQAFDVTNTTTSAVVDVVVQGY